MIITPEAGNQKEIGKRLLALADSPYDVQWVTWPSAGFSVPLELFRKFDSDGKDEAETEAPIKRRRRRSKETSTDNNTSEEE